MRLSLIATALLLPATIFAQEGPSPEQVAAMERLQMMVGQWEGEGWIMRGPGNPFEFHGREVVQSMIGGMVVTVEGFHEAPDATTGEMRVVHHAFGVFSYDGETGGYLFQAHLASGRSGTYSAAIGDDGKLVWGMNLPNREVRYTVTITDTEWFEIGESSADGERWSQFFELRLARM